VGNFEIKGSKVRREQKEKNSLYVNRNEVYKKGKFCPTTGHEGPQGE
jgi:hypothetical protein